MAIINFAWRKATTCSLANQSPMALLWTGIALR